MNNQKSLTQVRLLLEELCCEICRFEHTPDENQLSRQCVRIDREYYLDKPGLYADIRVKPEASDPYLIEVKFGHSCDTTLRQLKRKYSEPLAAIQDIKKIVLVFDAERHSDWQQFEAKAAGCLAANLELEIWNEKKLIQFLWDRFHVKTEAITPENLLEVKQAMERAQGYLAFGGESLAAYDHEPLKAELLWHLGPWKIQQIRRASQAQPRDILPPGEYRGIAVLLADMCSFSSYVRDTRDEQIVRESLTSFYSKARYQIINNGGMLYQFVGDEVVAFFGVPDRIDDFAESALKTAEALVSIGGSVSHNWQRKIDRLQNSGGVHIGLSIGDIQIVSMNPFGRTHIGAVGDCINVAARLMASAESGEIAVSNSLFQQLNDHSQSKFQEIDPVEGKNVGRIKAWKLRTEQRF
jgi:class 3 adenylate cyclase